MSEKDETQFLAFLRASADIRLIQWRAASPELLFVPEFPKRGPGQQFYHLWNVAFRWEPEYGRSASGQYYLKNTAGAPLIEYAREPIEDPKPIARGRVYWNTDFAIYNGPTYDSARFSRWFDVVVRWLRKNGTRVEIAKSFNQYWLPEAWDLRQRLTHPSNRADWSPK